MRKEKNKKSKIFYVLVIIFLIAGFKFYIGNVLGPVSDQDNEKILTIEKGMGVSAIISKLDKQNLIKSPFMFKVYVWWTGNSSKIKAGEHKLSTAMDAKTLLNVLVQGDKVDIERDITIIEGWNNQEIGQYLEKEGIVSKSDFLSAIAGFNNIEEYDFLKNKPSGVDIEGYLFPDTYRIFKNATAQDIIEKMLDNFDQKISSELRIEISKQNKSIFDIITLASIVEKELSTDEDRAISADIFYRRMEIGMPLQSDATVNYVTGKKETRPSLDDTHVDSLYNTYQNRGLPPGPISNPGLSAIKSVIYPKANDYYYFLTTEDGDVIYSKTNEEHAENKARYLN